MGRAPLLFLGGIVATAVCAEIVLRGLPVSTATMTGYYQDPDILAYPAHHTWTMATGWDLRNPHTLRANNWGFAAEHEFTADPEAVALIGDSYVEASMLAPRDRPAAQLEALLPGQRKVYAMGTPGTAMLDYAQRIRFANERFQIRDFVVLMEGADARQALCGSGNIVSRCLDPETLEPRTARHPRASAWTDLARHSALAQYLMSQLRFKPATVVKAMFTRKPPEEAGAGAGKVAPTAPDPEQLARAQAMVDAVVQQFFATVPRAQIRQLVFLVDGRRTSQAAPRTLAELERAHLILRLREQGATVHDLEPLYAAHAARSQRSLAVGPYDGHLNPMGLHLAMAAAAQSLAR
ncbi:MAG: hypothetical protein DI587_19650 [Variovorax paradoxus]|jgi:hypothetical protein|nr:MAG: hypothetical protein DI583_19650 [Variovorax paradoxus]PZQ07907.1 MAG: hypothetical protein DI587_19650 [Variovorax paradoxus]